MSIATGSPTDTDPAEDPQQAARRRRTVVWVVALAALGLIFDGYDLVVYGAVVLDFPRNPNEIGEVTPQVAGRWAATR